MIDVFMDLSAHAADAPALQNLIARSALPRNLGGIARHVTVVAPAGRLRHAVSLPRGWTLAESASPLPELSAALESAGRDRVALLVLLGPVDVSHEAVGVLRQCLERDPMFGFSLPRIACANRCCFAGLTRHGMGATSWLPRKILADLPESELMVEVVGPCMLVSSEVAGNFGPLDRQFECIAVAMIHYMANARRHGFRPVVANRSVVSIDDLDCKATTVQPLPELSIEDYTLLLRAVPDLDRSWQESRSASWERFEMVCRSMTAEDQGSRRPSLLIDARNAGPTFNGTTQAVLGVVQAIRALQPKWDVTLLAHQQGAVVHDLARAYAGWPVHTTVPNRSFTAALRLSQPWHIQELVDLHRVSLVNAYLMLDTINWDIGYAAPRRLEGTWQFLADHADALLFDSTFTGQRFLERFQSARSVPSLVTHFSFDPKEYVRDNQSARTAEEKFILVVGNSLDHKDVRHTVDALVSVFPFRRIKALGLTDAVSPFVTALHSGDVPDLEMHRLYATAEYVVYPSFYEGFGFPILTALAYGRTVLARRSALLEEVAAECDRRGRLVLFERRDELVELLGRLVHGEAVPEYPLGLGLTNGQPKGWNTVARNILEFLESIVREPSRSRWIAREHAVQQLMAYRT